MEHKTNLTAAVAGIIMAHGMTCQTEQENNMECTPQWGILATACILECIMS